jgi:hypothetical protein
VSNLVVADCILQDELTDFFFNFDFSFSLTLVKWSSARYVGVVLTGKYLSEKWLTGLCGGLLWVA